MGWSTPAGGVGEVWLLAITWDGRLGGSPDTPPRAEDA
jgi:hypothetical protein